MPDSSAGARAEQPRALLEPGLVRQFVRRRCRGAFAGTRVLRNLNREHRQQGMLLLTTASFATSSNASGQRRLLSTMTGGGMTLSRTSCSKRPAVTPT